MALVRHRAPVRAHPLFPSGLGDMAPTVIDTQTAAQQVAQETVPADAKVNDLSMLLSILSSIFLIVRS